MIVFFGMILLCGIILIAVGIFQMKYYYGCPHTQIVKIIGSVPYRNNTRGLSGLAIGAISSAAGMRHPVAEITLDDGSVMSVPLNTVVTDQLIIQYPELDSGGEVLVQFFGDHPKVAYLTNHKLAQTVMKVSLPLLIGIALVVLSVILLIFYFSIDPSTI